MKYAIKVESECGLWEGAETWVRQVMDALNANPTVQSLLDQDKTVSVAILSDNAMQKLNVQYRQKETTPNVLSFHVGGHGKAGAELLGEVLIAYPHASKDAKRFDRTPEEHGKYLYVHGVLHLLGYDHQSESETNIMEKLEDEIVQQTL